MVGQGVTVAISRGILVRAAVAAVLLVACSGLPPAASADECIQDVWYNRQSKIWNKDRDGYSRPPDSEVPVAILHEDFKAWDQAVNYPDYQKQFVVVIPVR